LTATIAGNPGPAPVVKGIVLPWSEVKVYVCIVKGTDGVAVLSQDALAAIAVEVNRIYRQAGMRFVFQQASVEVAGDAWKTLDFSRQPQRLIDLLNKQPSTGGLELYVLEQFLRDGQPIPGGDFPEGAVLATKTTGQSNTVAEMADGLAHELGHACGLPDIYSYYGIYDDAGNLVQFCQLEPDGVKPCEDYQKDDWSGTATTSYCAASLTQAVLIDRLVMNGYRTSETWDGKDISLGSVWGVWYEWTTSSKVCGEGTCDVGVMRRNASTGQLEPNMVRSPSHQ